MRTAHENAAPEVRRRSPAILGLRITFSGLLSLAVLALVGLAALNSEINLLFLLSGISLGVIVFSALAPVVMVRKVDVERIAPVAVIAGRSFTLVYVVRSWRRWMRSWSLVIREAPDERRSALLPLGFVDVLEPGDEKRLEMTGRCPARGRVALKRVRVASRFPFGLFSCSVDVDAPDELTVYPAVGRLRRDPWRQRHRAESQSARGARRQDAQRDEFYGVREYRPGDNLHWIHWRRSARLGQLIVRESVPARIEHLTVILDPWPAPAGGDDQAQTGGDRWSALPSRPGGLGGLLNCRGRGRMGGASEQPFEAAVEKTISLAATVLCEGLERGQRVGLIVQAAVPVAIAPSGGRSHRQRLLHELALLKPGAPGGLEELVSRIRWSSGWHGRCLVCATRPNPSHTRVLRFLTGRSESAIAVMSDSEAFDSLFEASSQSLADRLLAERGPAAAGRAR